MANTESAPPTAGDSVSLEQGIANEISNYISDDSVAPQSINSEEGAIVSSVQNDIERMFGLTGEDTETVHFENPDTHSEISQGVSQAR